MGSPLSRPVRAEDKCPVDHKNMTQEEIDTMMAQYKRMASTTQLPAEHPSPPLADTTPSTSPPKSPADNTSLPKDKSNGSSLDPNTGSNTPPSNRDQDPIYDVYGQQLDKSNLMPSTPNQLPAPGQKQPLSTDRIQSSIPKSGGDTSETWTYPSPQMFFNALKRKGKADNVEEQDMDSVVAIHNSMNETTWQQVLQWEQRYHCHQCTDPKLKRFQGKPNDLSPAARVRMWVWGYPRPFDRHDWVVDRCGEEDVRYIIDYYYREGPDPIEIHVRPAIDSVSAVLDRVRYGAERMREGVIGTSDVREYIGEAGKAVGYLDQVGRGVVQGETLEGQEFEFLSSLTAKGLEEIADDVRKRCSGIGEAFREAAGDPVKMERANMSVNYCMAQRICGEQAKGFMQVLEGGGGGEEVEQAYGKMTNCLDRFHIMARRAMMEAAGVPQSGPEFPAGVVPSVGGRTTPSVASSVE